MKSNFKNIWKCKSSQSRIHLDYASTTPVCGEVLEAMLPYFSEQWANPSAIYTEGVEAKRVIEDMRAEVARTLRVRATDITFTSGGTESNNLVLIGLVEALFDAGRKYKDMEIVSTRIEHPSILETLSYLEKRGVHIVYVPVESDGRITAGMLASLLSAKTILVTCAYANSEIGVVQDIKKITRVVRAFTEESHTKIFVHVDASQAPLWLPCALDMLGVDMMTLDAGKCYGPKGVGILVHRHWVPLRAILHGGGQERGLRSGTENTALIVGCVRACVRAQEKYLDRSSTVAELREYLFSLLTTIPNVVVNGSREQRIANNVNISIPGLDTEYAVIWLDTKGIAVSTKSACGAKESTGSNVVRHMIGDELRALSTLRFTLGEETRRADIEKAVVVLKEFITMMAENIPEKGVS